MERYLHKFGYIQNQNHAKFMAQELVSVDCGLTKEICAEQIQKDPFDGRPREEVWNEMREADIKDQEIADKFGVTRSIVNSSVYRYRKDNDLSPIGEYIKNKRGNMI